MDPLPEDLKQLNEETFYAENKEKIREEDWETFFRRVLSPDFIISRANRMMQTKEGMIEQIRIDERVREGPTHVEGGIEGDYGVVTSKVTVKGDAKNIYHNLKAFQRGPTGAWQCVYWRVVGHPVQQEGG